MRRPAGVLNTDGAQVERLKAYWLYRIIYGLDPLREKMTLFWHGHFATSNRKVQNVERMLAQNELLRRLALGDFRELAAAILSDPAMLIWLDGVGTQGEARTKTWHASSLSSSPWALASTPRPTFARRPSRSPAA